MLCILVFDWSIPSMINVKNFSGDDQAFSQYCYKYTMTSKGSHRDSSLRNALQHIQIIFKL